MIRLSIVSSDIMPAVFINFRYIMRFNSRFKACIGTLAVISFLTVDTSLAQANTSNSSEIDTVSVIATRQAQTLNEISASVSSVDDATLSLVAHTHINEAMVRVPGVWVSRGNGQEHLTAIRSPVFTGPGSCGAFLVTENGIPTRANGFCNVNQLFDLNTEQAERIEVLRGPGTAIHGSNALHGVINIVTQSPTPSLENQIGLELGPHDYARVRLSRSNTTDNQGYAISFNGVHDNGYKRDSGFDQQKFNLRHDITLDDVSISNTISLSNLNQETAGFIEGEDAYKDDSLRKANDFPEAYRDSQSARLASRIEKSLGDNRSITVTPYFRYTDMEFLMHFLPAQPTEENGQRSLGLQSAYRQAIDDTLTLSSGFDVEYTDAFLKQTQDGGFSRFPEGKQYDYQLTAATFAMFSQAQYTVNDKVQLNTGARFEHLKYDYDNRMIDGNTDEFGNSCVSGGEDIPCRYSRPADRDDDFENISLNAGLIVAANDNIDVLIRRARGYRAPQATELYRLQEGQSVTTIDSEEIDSLELGLRGRYESIGFNLTLFSMEKDNVIFQDTERRNLDNGETKHEGLEYDLAWQINQQLRLTLAGTLAKHTYEEDVLLLGSNVEIEDNDIDTAPRHQGSLQLAWQITSNWLSELEWVHVGKYYTDIDNANQYEGHELVNWRNRYQLTPALSVAWRITNLLNVDYAERADFSGFSNQERYFIGESRSSYVQVDYRF